MIANVFKSLVFMLACSLLLTGCVANAETETTQRVLKALTQSNHRLLASQFTNQVTITVNNETRQYSKTQATFVMRAFFRQNPAVSFEYLHQGLMKNGRPYSLGIYRTPTHTYSLALLLVPQDKDYLIEKMVFANINHQISPIK
ncbi:hypothetical protein BKI52_33485 [marine bacterium AO1-C]|nr:hypothetical protein BKI52_33485 [marine bacterium AO1-C]